MSKRKFLTPAQKIAIAREHLIDGVPVSSLVDKHKIHAVQFYHWQKLLFEEGAVVFERKPNYNRKIMSWPSCCRSTSN